MEVYGVKPRMFTKKWWGYFWYYYKIHTMVIIFAVLFIGTSAVQCATQPKYDLNFDFVSEYGVPFEYQDKLENLANQVIEDADKNGKVMSSVLLLDLSENGDVQTSKALQTKFYLEQAAPSAYVFIASERYAKVLEESGIIQSPELWAEDIEGQSPMVYLGDSAVMREIGIDAEAEKLYVGVVGMSERAEKNETERAKYENGVRFARHLIGLE